MALTTEQLLDNQIERNYQRFRAKGDNGKKETLTAFQLLRRLECSVADGYKIEVDEKGKPHSMGNCISCGKLKSTKELDGGHFVTRENNVTALMRNNVFSQCVYCNRHLHGNPVEYRKRLIERIGIDEVRVLEAYKGHSVPQFKPWQYAQLREAYIEQIKQLAKQSLP